MIYKYDGRGEQCPVPLLNLRLMLKKMVSGDECIILINDKGSVKDIPKFLSKKGYQFNEQTIDKQIVTLSVKI